MLLKLVTRSFFVLLLFTVALVAVAELSLLSGTGADAETQVDTISIRVPVYSAAKTSAPPRLPIILNRNSKTVELWKNERDGSIDLIVTGMERLASTEYPYSLSRLMGIWYSEGALMTNPRKIASLIYDNSIKYGVDPFILVALLWHESHFNASAKGDCRTGCMDRDWEFRECTPGEKPVKLCMSCGIAQINTRADESRPDCSRTLSPRFSIEWATKRLSETRDFDKRYRGRHIIHRYNSKKEKLSWNYERDVWRSADLARGTYPVGRNRSQPNGRI